MTPWAPILAIKSSPASSTRVAPTVNPPASFHRVSALTLLPDSSWDWPATNRGMWEVVDGKDEFQEFYNHWRTSSYTFCSSGPFPYKLQLGNESPLHPYSTSDGQIVVTKSYDEMYYRLLALRETRAPGSGAVITGQPGIGTSIRLNPRLVRQLIGVFVTQENLSFLISCSHG